MPKETPDTIKFVQGDTAKFALEIKAGKDLYTPKPTDRITFKAEQKHSNHNPARIHKDIDPTTMLLVFDPEDTCGLPYGEYEYDIKLKTDDFTSTVISRETMYLVQEVRGGDH